MPSGLSMRSARYHALSVFGVVALIVGVVQVSEARYIDNGSSCKGTVDSVWDPATNKWVATAIYCSGACKPAPGNCIEIVTQSGPGWAYKTCGCRFFDSEGNPILEIWELTSDPQTGDDSVVCDAQSVSNTQGYNPPFDAWCTELCPGGSADCEAVIVGGGTGPNGTIWKREACDCP